MEGPSACWQAAAHTVCHPRTLQQPGSGYDVCPLTSWCVQKYQASCSSICDIDQSALLTRSTASTLQSSMLAGAETGQGGKSRGLAVSWVAHVSSARAAPQDRDSSRGTPLSGRLTHSTRPAPLNTATPTMVQRWGFQGPARTRTVRLLGRVRTQAGASGSASWGGSVEGVVRAPVSGRPHLLLLEGGLQLRGQRGCHRGVQPLPAAASVTLPRLLRGAWLGSVGLRGVLGRGWGKLECPAPAGSGFRVQGSGSVGCASCASRWGSGEDGRGAGQRAWCVRGCRVQGVVAPCCAA